MERAEQKNQYIVQQNVNSHNSQHERHVLELQPSRSEKNHRDYGHGDEQGRIEAGHGSQCPQHQKQQLAGTGKPVDRGGAVDVVEQIRHLRTSRSWAIKRRVNSSESSMPQAAARW